VRGRFASAARAIFKPWQQYRAGDNGHFLVPRHGLDPRIVGLLFKFSELGGRSVKTSLQAKPAPMP
jgi:hypothetical protein